MTRNRQQKSGKHAGKLKSKKKTDMLKSIGESVESVMKKKRKGYSGKDLQKRKVFTLE